MNRIFTATFVATALMASVSLDASASARQAEEPKTQPWIEVINLPADPEADKPVRKSRLAEKKNNELPVDYQFVYRDNCLRYTGSRLLRTDRADNQRCANAAGRVYLREGLDSHGNMSGLVR